MRIKIISTEIIVFGLGVLSSEKLTVYFHSFGHLFQKIKKKKKDCLCYGSFKFCDTVHVGKFPKDSLSPSHFTEDPSHRSGNPSLSSSPKFPPLPLLIESIKWQKFRTENGDGGEPDVVVRRIIRLQ